MGLGANTINRDPLGNPSLDIANHGLRLCIRCGVETSHCQNYTAASGLSNLLVVVDVQLRCGIRLLCCLESNPDKGLTKDVVEHTRTEVTVLCKESLDAKGVSWPAHIPSNISLMTSHAYTLPLYRVIRVVMWFCMTVVKVALSRIELTQLGS